MIVVRGAGDLATGTIARLSRAGFLVAALEIERPTAIRRSAALSEAVYEGSAGVEGIRAVLVRDPAELRASAAPGIVPILIDAEAASLAELRPAALVDAIIAKRNLGTRADMAPVVVALGPGFTAGGDVHAVVETNRGHDLGRVIWSGPSEPNTGVPGLIGGYGAERVLKAPFSGRIEAMREIGDTVTSGDPVFAVRGDEYVIVRSAIGGIVRGMIRDGFIVGPGFKAADVDPRARRENCFSISDKARSIGGGVLEALLARGVRP